MTQAELQTQIMLNGEQKRIESGLTVQTLLESLALDARKVAIERNRAIVLRSMYDKEMIHDGDAIEIVECIGGG